jgi:hypothetical protein
MRNFLWLALVCYMIPAAGATTITLRSGNGTVGSTDSLITFLDGPNGTDFAALTSTDFSNARSGSAASIVPPNGAWISTLIEDASAQWIGDNSGASCCAGNSSLYAESFFLPSSVLSATLTVHYATDNFLGSATNSGIFLNGTPVSPVPATGSFTFESSYSNSNIGPLLHQGTNFIYFDAVNGGGPAGFIYTATITTVDAPAGGGSAPEPSSWLLAAGSLGALFVRRRFLRGRL